MIDEIRQSIHQRYHLHPKRRGEWELSSGVQLRTSARDSFGFSLDTEVIGTDIKPFAMLSDSPPSGIAQMCDAILVLNDQDNMSIFIIEQKGTKTRNYEAQMANGKFFSNWLISVCKNQGYGSGQSIEYIGLLLWGKRKSPRKGSTTHQGPSDLRHPLFEKSFDCNNMNLIPLDNLTTD